MGAYFRQAEAALRAYWARGEEALCKLAEGDDEAAARLMVGRNAAFHNFKAADFHETAAGNGDAIKILLAAWMPKILMQGEKLSEAMANSASALRQEWQNHRTNREKIKKFHSGNSDNSGFSGSV